MKNILLFLLSYSLILSATAFEIQFIGGCTSKPLFTQKVTFIDGMNLGVVSLQVLDENNIPYQGTPSGLNQVFNTPIGSQAWEVISDQEMMAYGWCFEIDGKIPEFLPHEVLITESTKVITWFYGYAQYLNGNWISQCEKSFLRQSPHICAQ